MRLPNAPAKPSCVKKDALISPPLQKLTAKLKVRIAITLRASGSTLPVAVSALSLRPPAKKEPVNRMSLFESREGQHNTARSVDDSDSHSTQARGDGLWTRHDSRDVVAFCVEVGNGGKVH